MDDLFSEAPSAPHPNLRTVSRLIGAGSKDNREKDDYYATPPDTTAAFLRRFRLRNRVWEPACGAGHMANVLIDHGYEVHATDLVERGYGTPRVDFLMEWQVPEGINSLCTNPPFKLGAKFVRHAMAMGIEQIAILHKLAFLESKGRIDLFERSDFRGIFVYQERQSLWKNGAPMENGMLALAWFIWDVEQPASMPSAINFI